MTTHDQPTATNGTPAGPLSPAEADKRIVNGGERCKPYSDTRWSVEHLHRYTVARLPCRVKRVLDVASGQGCGSALLAGRFLNPTRFFPSPGALAPRP